MNPFNLPLSTQVGRNIPKNAFDNFASPSQRRMFKDRVAKITWLQKISTDTTNLPAGETKEIQVFEIQLKEQINVNPVLEVIQKAIPYAVVAIVTHDGAFHLSTAHKHPNPLDENKAVVDWSFNSAWQSLGDFGFKLRLSKSIEYIHLDLCAQISKRPLTGKLTLPAMVAEQHMLAALNREVDNLRSAIRKEMQFNRKVELNLQLLSKKAELAELIVSINNN